MTSRAICGARGTASSKPARGCPGPGAGDAELDESGSLVGEIRYHNGDESAFKARRW